MTPKRATTDRERFFAEEEPGRRGEILDAALDVFSDRGYDGGSMRAIAEKVGVSEPALYRHFPGKEAIFVTLLRLTAGRLRNEAFDLIDALEPTTVRPQLIALFADRRLAIRRYAPLLQALVPSVSRSPRFLEELRTTIITPVKDRLAEKVALIDVSLGLPAAESEATREGRVRALVALVVGYFVTSFVLGDAPDDTIADAALRVLGWDQL